VGEGTSGVSHIRRVDEGILWAPTRGCEQCIGANVKSMCGREGVDRTSSVYKDRNIGGTNAKLYI
jgi:hypothetical protein